MQANEIHGITILVSREKKSLCRTQPFANTYYIDAWYITEVMQFSIRNLLTERFGNGTYITNAQVQLEDIVSHSCFHLKQVPLS
jgi:hypothetical protein